MVAVALYSHQVYRMFLPRLSAARQRVVQWPDSEELLLYFQLWLPFCEEQSTAASFAPEEAASADCQMKPQTLNKMSSMYLGNNKTNEYCTDQTTWHEMKENTEMKIMNRNESVVSVVMYLSYEYLRFTIWSLLDLCLSWSRVDRDRWLALIRSRSSRVLFPWYGLLSVTIKGASTSSIVTFGVTHSGSGRVVWPVDVGFVIILFWLCSLSCPVLINCSSSMFAQYRLDVSKNHSNINSTANL